MWMIPEPQTPTLPLPAAQRPGRERQRNQVTALGRKKPVLLERSLSLALKNETSDANVAASLWYKKTLNIKEMNP